MEPFLVNAEATKVLRERALMNLANCLALPTPRISLRAIKSLTYALAQPHGLFGMPVSPEDVQGWIPEQIRILDMLFTVSKDTKEPLVSLKAAEAVQWEARYAASFEVREKSKAVIASVSNTFAVRLTGALITIDSQKTGCLMRIKMSSRRTSETRKNNRREDRDSRANFWRFILTLLTV